MTTDLPIAAGELIAGKYRVERLLGDGGMGVVVAATHIKLGERRAIKMMRPAIALNTESTRRFLREAQAAARLKSEHVAKVYDVDEMAGGVPYMVMEYLEGADLAAVLASEGALPVPEAVLYVRQACEALAEAHAAGLVHRDIKPSNLFLTKRPDGSPSIKVLDFGIAKAVMGDAATKTSAMTAQGLMLGTAHYMSPEQMDAATDIDARTDIWSLGVTLYELVSGAVPFDADGMLKLFALVTEGEPRPLAEIAPAVPEALEALILRCLEKPRDRRPASAIELAEALRPFAPEGGPRRAISRACMAPTQAAPAVSAKARTSLDMELDTAASPRDERAAPSPQPAASEPAAAAITPAPRATSSRPLLLGGASAAAALALVTAVMVLRPASSPPAPSSWEPARTAPAQGASIDRSAPAGQTAPPARDPEPPVTAAASAPPIVEPASAMPAPPPPPSASVTTSAASAPRPRPSAIPRPTAAASAAPRPATPSRTEVNIP